MNSERNERIEATEGRELIAKGAVVRVHKKRTSPPSWDYRGRMTVASPVVVGQRMYLLGTDGGDGLDTSAVRSAEIADGEIVVHTAHSTYSLKIAHAPEAKNEKGTDWTVQGLMAALGEKVQRTFRGY
jgi:hypothetical protein